MKEILRKFSAVYYLPFIRCYLSLNNLTLNQIVLVLFFNICTKLSKQDLRNSFLDRTKLSFDHL